MAKPQPPRLRSFCLALLLLGLIFAKSHPFLEPALAEEAKMILYGSIQRVRGNRLPGPANSAVADVSKDQEIVVVQGRINPLQLGDPFLPAAKLTAPIVGRGRSDATGTFKLEIANLPPENCDVTVLLVIPGGFYLNRFDSSGSFASFCLPQDFHKKINLIDDREAIF
jgi:hypothetical protein